MDKPSSLGSVLVGTWYRFWGYTNVGGLTQAYHSHGYVFRAVWLILFCFGAFSTFKDVLNVVEDYMANLHTSQTDIVFERSALFPAVTVCNQNRIDCENLVKAAIVNFTYQPLRKIVKASNCFEKSGLSCPFVWRLFVQNSLPNGFSTLYKPGCLECGQCFSFVSWASAEFSKGNITRGSFETVYAQMNCNTICGYNIVDILSPDALGFGGGPGGPGPGGGRGPRNARKSNRAGFIFADNTEKSFEKVSLFLEHRRRRRMALEGPGQGPDGSPNGCLGPFCGSSFRLVSPSATFNNKMRLMASFMTLPPEMRHQVGNEFSDMIMECTYLGVDCTDPVFFQRTTSPLFGNCFTFNGNISQGFDEFAGRRKTSLTGELYSLDLLIYLKHYAYPPTLTDKKGARVEIHPPNVMPNIEENGMDVMPNTATAFGVEQTTIRRLRKPYESQCVSNWTEVNYFPTFDPSMPDVMANEKYNNKRCTKFCLQHQFQQMCNCSHPIYPMPSTFRAANFKFRTDYPPCNLEYYTSNFNCTAAVRNQFDNLQLLCHCPVACFELNYKVSSSTAQWPRETYKETAVSRMGIDIDDLGPKELDSITDDMLELKVYIKTLDTARLEQYPYISEHSLLSDIGGAMSLYLGISLIMVVEIFELFFTALWNTCLFVYNKHKLPSIIDIPDRKPNGDDLQLSTKDLVKVGSLYDNNLIKPVYTSPNT